jgi:hypothetical protein
MERRMLRQNRRMRKLLAYLYMFMAIMLVSGLLWFIYPQIQEVRNSPQGATGCVLVATHISPGSDVIPFT